MGARKDGLSGAGPGGAGPDDAISPLARARISNSETTAPYSGDMRDPSVHPNNQEPAMMDSVSPPPAQLPASLYDRAIDLRYWGVALLVGAALWAVLFKLV